MQYDVISCLGVQFCYSKPYLSVLSHICHIAVPVIVVPLRSIVCFIYGFSTSCFCYTMSFLFYKSQYFFTLYLEYAVFKSRCVFDPTFSILSVKIPMYPFSSDCLRLMWRPPQMVVYYWQLWYSNTVYMVYCVIWTLLFYYVSLHRYHYIVVLGILYHVFCFKICDCKKIVANLSVFHMNVIVLGFYLPNIRSLLLVLYVLTHSVVATLGFLY